MKKESRMVFVADDGRAFFDEAGARAYEHEMMRPDIANTMRRNFNIEDYRDVMAMLNALVYEPSPENVRLREMLVAYLSHNPRPVEDK